MNQNRPNSLGFTSTIMENGLTEKYHEQDMLELYLIVLSGPDQGRQFKLNRRENCFGRASDANIVLSDPKISRYHGAFIIYPDRIGIEDRQSSNGVYVDGKRIEQATITSVSRIQLGNSTFKLEYKKTGEAESDHALYQAANLDALTRIYNRGAFMLRAADKVESCAKTNTPIWIVLCDVDHFKLKNDTYGHPAGDQVLKDLAALLSAHLREGDLLARYGGEEFIMLLTATGKNETMDWAEKVRQAVASHPFCYDGQLIPTTFSIGISGQQSGQSHALNTLIKSADEALYAAKNSGRNRITLNIL